MILQAPVVGHDIRSRFVVAHRSVEEVQAHAIAAVVTAFLRVEVIECASVVLVHVAAFDEHAFGGVRDL